MKLTRQQLPLAGTLRSATPPRPAHAPVLPAVASNAGLAARSSVSSLTGRSLVPAAAAGPHVASRTALFDADHENPLTPDVLRDLVNSGDIKALVDHARRQQIGSTRLVCTDNQLRQAALFAALPELKLVDTETRTLLGEALWGELEAAHTAWSDFVDVASNTARLAPEGIHPIFAEKAKPFLAAAGGVPVTPAALAAADRALADCVRDAPEVAAWSLEVFLVQFQVDRTLAPRAFEALARRLPPLPPLIQEVVAQGGTSRLSPAALAQLDGELSELLRTLPAEQWARAAQALTTVGISEDILHLLRWPASAAAREQLPRTAEALSARDIRHELLTRAFAADPRYARVTAAREAALSAGVEATLAYDGPDSPYAASLAHEPREQVALHARELLEWSLQQTQKLGLAESEFIKHDRPETRGIPLAARTVEQVFMDHLQARREGDLARDVRLNYAPDMMITSNKGNFFGGEGVFGSASVLGSLVPGRVWSMERLSFIPGETPQEGVVYETWSAQIEGKLVTGFDAFDIKDGQIRSQTIYYFEDPAQRATSAAATTSLQH